MERQADRQAGTRLVSWLTNAASFAAYCRRSWCVCVCRLCSI